MTAGCAGHLKPWILFQMTWKAVEGLLAKDQWDLLSIENYHVAASPRFVSRI